MKRNELNEPDTMTVGFAPLSALPETLDEEALIRANICSPQNADTDIETAVKNVLDAELAPLATAIKHDQYIRRRGIRKPYDCEVVLYAQYILPDEIVASASISSLNGFLSHALVASKVILDADLIDQRLDEKLPAQRNEPHGIWYAIGLCDCDSSIAKYRELERLIARAKSERRAFG